jgi:PIN domain nuclease of toxin-antitoxin system
MQESMASGSRVLLSAISIVEMIYLVEKNRLDATALRELQAVIADPEGGFWIAPMDYRICRFVEQIPREAVPDMPDRIIAATALALEMPLVTCDESIRSSPVTTIW